MKMYNYVGNCFVPVYTLTSKKHPTPQCYDTI